MRYFTAVASGTMLLLILKISLSKKLDNDSFLLHLSDYLIFHGLLDHKITLSEYFQLSVYLLINLSFFIKTFRTLCNSSDKGSLISNL